jgi:hypothetical protein
MLGTFSSGHGMKSTDSLGEDLPASLVVNRGLNLLFRGVGLDYIRKKINQKDVHRRPAEHGRTDLVLSLHPLTVFLPALLLHLLIVLQRLDISISNVSDMFANRRRTESLL